MKTLIWTLHIIKADKNGSKQGWRNRLNENGTGAVVTDFQIFAVKVKCLLRIKNINLLFSMWLYN